MASICSGTPLSVYLKSAKARYTLFVFDSSVKAYCCDIQSTMPYVRFSPYNVDSAIILYNLLITAR